jgi:ribonuclease HII
LSQKNFCFKRKFLFFKHYTHQQYCSEMIVGIDEVGRGCWAGPLLAGAVVLSNPISGLRDSKKLSKRQRESLAPMIMEQAFMVGIGWVSAQEVDKLGLTAAVRLAMQRALQQIRIPYDKIIIDGSYNFLSDNPKASTLVKADNLIPAVSAASIIAKVTRDRYMAELGKQFPAYGFERHVGYGTAQHLAALKEYGVILHHRTSYKPVAALVQ